MINFSLNQLQGQDWDTHVNNFGLMKNTLLPPMDLAVSALLDDLVDLGAAGHHTGSDLWRIQPYSADQLQR